MLMSKPIGSAGLALIKKFEGCRLTAYCSKTKAESTAGGIVYDAALGVPNSDTAF